MTNAKISSFFAVVKYQNFSKAAEHLYISQSAVSKNVSQLEKEVGFILVERSNGIVRLTTVGKLFYDHFMECEEKYKKVLEDAALLASNATGNINLGCLDGWDLSQFYPQIRSVFSEKHPNVRINLQGYNHVHILDALLEGRIDIAITLKNTITHNQRFTNRTIATAPSILMFSAMHPLAETENLSLYDFRNEPFYVISPVQQGTNPMEMLTLQLCREAGFEPIIEYLPSSANILLRLQSGTGAQITCKWTCASNFPLYKYITLNHMLDIDAAWIDDLKTPSKHIFLNELMNLNLIE